MQCPNCKVEMEKGILNFHGTKWQRPLGKACGSLNFLQKGTDVIARECPKCQKVGLSVEEK